MARSLMDPQYVPEGDPSQVGRGMLARLMQNTVDVPANLLNATAIGRIMRLLAGNPDTRPPSELAPAARGSGPGYEFGQSLMDVAPAVLGIAPRSVGSAAAVLGGNEIGAVGAGVKRSGAAMRSSKLAEAKAGAEGPLRAKDLMDSSSAVAARRAAMRESLSLPVDPWVPPTDSYFDRSLIPQAMSGHPGVTQEPIARVAPGPRANLAPANNLFTADNLDLVKMMVDRGKKLGGETYYPSTFPIRARYAESNGPLTFDDFVWANAATSPQAPLPINIPNATLMLHLKRRGIEPTWENAQKLAQDLKAEYGTGYFLGPGHVSNWNEAQKNGKLIGFDSQQKIASYGEGLRGNFTPYAIDTHETKGLSMGTGYFPYFDKQKGVNPAEYSTIEKSASKLADDMGLLPANMQASRWFGGGELTGLKSPRGDYLNTLEDLIRWNAEKRGWDTSRAGMQKKIDEVLQGDEVLLPYWRKGPQIQFNRTLFD